MENQFAIIRQVCEHAQASGMIKTLTDAVKVSQALQHVAALLEEVQALRARIIKMEAAKADHELHS